MMVWALVPGGKSSGGMMVPSLKPGQRGSRAGPRNAAVGPVACRVRSSCVNICALSSGLGATAQKSDQTATAVVFIFDLVSLRSM